MPKTSPYIAMMLRGPSPSGKTKIWDVVNIHRPEDPEDIGTVHWHGAWRRYVFEQWGSAFYDQYCLYQISQFLEHATYDHMHGKRGENCLNCGRIMEQLEQYTYRCECMPPNVVLSIG